MGRAKSKMELIMKEKTRNTTYQNRKQGIIKKANELTILCDVDTVMIVFPPNSNQPEIWPENPDQIKKTIDSYKAKKSESGKQTYDLNDFFQDRKKKIEDELVKARKRNMEAKYSTWFDERLSEGQLRQFTIGLENKENIVRALLEFKKRSLNMQMPFRFEIENNQPMAGIHYMGSHPGLDQVQAMNNELGLEINENIMAGIHCMGSHTELDQVQVMNNELGLENNENIMAGIHYMGSQTGLDQVQAMNHELGLENKENIVAGIQYIGSHPGLDQVQAMNLNHHHLMNHELGKFNDAAQSTSFIPMKCEVGGGFDRYPSYEGGVVYDNSNPWGFQPLQPVIQCDLMPEMAIQDSHVNYDNSNPWRLQPLQPLVQCGLIPEIAIEDSHVNYYGYEGVGVDFVNYDGFDGDFVMDDFD